VLWREATKQKTEVEGVVGVFFNMAYEEVNKLAGRMM